ncbi:MAG: alpha-isopropylmalate synthase regulatory domain-containing protein, partial [Usitatibacter sp.]
HRETYEIMKASDVGWGTNRLTLGKLSGRSAFKSRLQELGIALASEEQLNAAFARFKELADKKREIFDEDIQALMSDETVAPETEHYKLVSLTAHSETGEQPFARVVISEEGREKRAEARGGGPVDATFKAIESIVDSGAELLLYSVNNVTEGTDSQGEVSVRLSKHGRIVNGMGSDTDIVVASAKAYLSALNKLAHKSRMNPQYGAEAVI